MTLPNFIIIGAAKAGTTSCYRYLGQHPDIFVSPQKETNFFAYQNQPLDFHWWGSPPTAILQSVTTLAKYEALFQGAANYQAIGEASPLYLYHPQAAANIRRQLPKARLIAILRHPAERAFSHYSHLVRDGREPADSFATALAVEAERIKAGWVWDYHYREMGYYCRQLMRYYDQFPAGQIKVFLYEELVADIAGILQQIFRFLGVDDQFVPDTTFRHNISGTPKSKVVQATLSQPNLLRRLARFFIPHNVRLKAVARIRQQNLIQNQLNSQDRQQLVDNYHQDINALSSLIQRDLSLWLS